MFGFLDFIAAIIFITLYITWKYNKKDCTHIKNFQKDSKTTDSVQTNDTKTADSVLEITRKNSGVKTLICNFENNFGDQETLSERRPTSILDAQKKNLETASQEWKKRVEPSDAVNYSVAGRMNHNDKEINETVLKIANGDKKTPQPNRFRSRNGKSSLFLTSLKLQ